MNGLCAGSQTSTVFLFLSFSFILLLLTLAASCWLNAAELLPPVKMICLTIFSGDSAISSVLDLSGGREGRDKRGGWRYGVGGEQDEGMSEYWTGAVGGAPGGYGTTRSLAFTERRSQPAHQYSLSRLSSGLQRGRQNKVAEVMHCTRWWGGGGWWK